MTEKAVLTTSTGEPYQPVRLTYSVPSRVVARKALSKLRCIGEDVRGGPLTVWLTDEARDLFGKPEARFELFGQSVILGTFRFPNARTMTLQVRSHERAKGIAKLVRVPLGPSVTLVRCRMVNRLFAAAEQAGELGELDRCLDRDVVKRVEPPRDPVEEAELRAAVFGRTDKLQALDEYYARKRANRTERPPDVPLVEDFPLWPEEETDDLRDLRMLLDFRFARAVRRWQGEDVTLREVIEQTFDAQHAQAVARGR